MYVITDIFISCALNAFDKCFHSFYLFLLEVGTLVIFLGCALWDLKFWYYPFVLPGWSSLGSTAFQVALVVKNAPANASQVALLVKNLPANVGDLRLVFDPWVGKILWKGNGNPLQYYYLENSMDRGACWVPAVHGVTKSQTQLKQLSMHEHFR